MTRDDEAGSLGFCRLDDEPGPAVSLTPERARALVGDILERAVPSRLPAAKLRTRPLHWLLAAAVLASVTGAIAAGSWIVVPGLRGAEPPAAGEPLVGPALKSNEPALIRGTTPRPDPEPPSTLGSVDAAPAAPPSGAPPRARLPPGAPAETADAEPAPASTDLLLVANQLRGQGRWREAERAYTDVIRLHPQSRDAYVATLAAASLRLEKLGDPSGALRLYESVMQRGSLVEEAQYGAARCHRSLGNTAAETQVLEALLVRYPNSLRRQQIERRLDELGHRASHP